AVPAPKTAAPDAREVTLQLPTGPVKAERVMNGTFPLAAWVAGLPLSAHEVSRLEALASRVFEDKGHRLVIVAHQQTLGDPARAAKRASSGAGALQRYLQATQMVPKKRILTTVIEE